MFSLAKLFKVDDSLAEITKLARVGSGSACRSIYGGFVKWNQGTAQDGSDSIAEQVSEGFLVLAKICKYHIKYKIYKKKLIFSFLFLLFFHHGEKKRLLLKLTGQRLKF